MKTEKEIMEHKLRTKNCTCIYGCILEGGNACHALCLNPKCKEASK